MTLLESLTEWALATGDVQVATVFGSQARALCGEGEPADAWSDVDFQIVTSEPRQYDTREWTNNIPGQQLHAYAVRPVFGGAKKVTALFSGGEADFVIVAYQRLRFARFVVALRLHRCIPAIERALGDLALVMSFGHMVLKGGNGWKRFYATVIKEIPHKHLDDAHAVSIADGAYVDAVSIINRLNRGELVAAQRWLHRSVIEANLQILNELRVRQGLATFPDGRRVERLLPPQQLAAVRFEASLDVESIHAATIAAVGYTRRLIHALTGFQPTWPELPSRLRAE